MEKKRLGDWILCFSGEVFWPLDPRVEEIHIEDIAVALCRQPRYAGHTKYAYSVGQHSCYVADNLYKEYKSKTLALRGLLHDGSEAYTNDIIRPLKRLEVFKLFREVEDNLQKVIYRAFGLDTNDLHDKLVHAADMKVFNDEVNQILNHKEKMSERLNLTYGFAGVIIEKTNEDVVLDMFMKKFNFYSEV